MKKWAIGCLNSGIKQAAKLGLSILTAYTVGTPLNVHTLAITVSVGFVWGVGEYVMTNPIPDGTPVPVIDARQLPPLDGGDK